MSSRSRIIIAVTLIFMISASASAFAGFQMRNSQFGGDTGVSSGKKVEDVDKEFITSVISSETEGQANQLKPASTDAQPAAVGGDVNNQDFIPSSAEKAPAPAPAEDPNMVTGFGKDLPLVISLQQIVPAKYKIVLDETIDGKTLTSWTGGAGWEQVLDRMLQKHNFSYNVNGTVLSIKNNAPKLENISRTPVAKSADTATEAPVVKADNTKPSPVVKATKGKKLSAKAKKAQKEQKEQVAKNEDFKHLYDASTRQARQERNEKDDKDGATPLNILDPLPPVNNVKPAPAPAIEYNPDAKIEPNWRLANARWVARKDQSLKEVLGEWSKQEGVELYWAIDYDYHINRDIALGGEYANAVARLLNVFKDVRPQPYGQLHKGTRGPLVLVVNSYDLSH